MVVSQITRIQGALQGSQEPARSFAGNASNPADRKIIFFPGISSAYGGNHQIRVLEIL
jgi:hypothetical protein